MNVAKKVPLTEDMDNVIELSKTTKVLLSSFSSIKEKQPVDEFTKLQVSQAVSFLALVYEKVRNAIEYREDHLLRRAAIERILKRRLAMNPQAVGEAENLLRELMWARYFANGSLGQNDISVIQKIIDRYLQIKKELVTGRNGNSQVFLSQFLFDMLTCEIEENLSPAYAKRQADFIYFIFQTIHKKVKVADLTEAQKDAFLFIGLEKSYGKTDIAYQRYHTYCVFYKPLSQYSEDELKQLTTSLPEIFTRLDKMIRNPLVEKLMKFTRKQLPPFLILFDIIKEKKQLVQVTLTDKKKLWTEVDSTCRKKYQLIKSRLNTLAIRSLIYIFITKMLLAIIIEVPLSKLIYDEINYGSIAINSIAPPIMMLLIVLTIHLPGEDNTKRIYQRLIDIVNADPKYEQSIALITKKPKAKRPLLVLGFTIFYTLTFIITLLFIHDILAAINFNILSQLIFIFFISVISFFAYRIKQVANEYRLLEKDSIFQPLIDFFFMPILSLGKLFSEGISQLNVFIVLFDFIIEAPYKLIIEVIEEWMTFVRARKEEIM